MEIRVQAMDKGLVEVGYVVKAKVEWYGVGNFTYPHLWKENPTDTDYKESWGDPRRAKLEKVKKSNRMFKKS